MWIRTYNKSDELVQSAQINSKGETVSFYSIDGNEYVKYNKWDSDKVVEFQVADEEVELVENHVGTKFFRCVSKNNKVGGINYPTYNKRFSIENGYIMDFNIDQKIIQSWKKKAIRKTYQKRTKNT